MKDKREAARETRHHYEDVLAASKATYSTARILERLLWRANFYENETCVSKKELIEDLNLTRVTVQRGLAWLRNEGTIRAIENERGGRGLATRYSFHVPNGGKSRMAEAQAKAERHKGDGAQVWQAVLSYFQEEQPAVFARWVEPLEFVDVTTGTLSLEAPTSFIASHVDKTYSDAILAAGSAADPTIKRLRISAK